MAVVLLEVVALPFRLLRTKGELKYVTKIRKGLI